MSFTVCYFLFCCVHCLSVVFRHVSITLSFVIWFASTACLMFHFFFCFVCLLLVLCSLLHFHSLPVVFRAMANTCLLFSSLCPYCLFSICSVSSNFLLFAVICLLAVCSSSNRSFSLGCLFHICFACLSLCVSIQCLILNLSAICSSHSFLICFW